MHPTVSQLFVNMWQHLERANFYVTCALGQCLLVEADEGRSILLDGPELLDDVWKGHKEIEEQMWGQKSAHCKSLMPFVTLADDFAKIEKEEGYVGLMVSTACKGRVAGLVQEARRIRRLLQSDTARPQIFVFMAGTDECAADVHQALKGAFQMEKWLESNTKRISRPCNMPRFTR